MKNTIVITVFTIALIVLIGVIVYEVIQHPCIKSHKETIHHEARIEYQIHYIGKNKITVPVRHDAYDSLDVICDQYK